jgi:hypothetical protein
MGLLALGTPLNWEETKPLAEHIRYHGITQFLHTYRRWKDTQGKGLLCGDEVSRVGLASRSVRFGWLRQSDVSGLGAWAVRTACAMRVNRMSEGRTATEWCHRGSPDFLRSRLRSRLRLR